jgi:integrase
MCPKVGRHQLVPGCPVCAAHRTEDKNPDAENPHKTIVIFESPKSKSSRRCIPLPGFLLELLRKWKKSEDSFILQAAPVLCGAQILPKYFKKVLKKAGVQDTNFHTLRHTFATKCVSLGFDARL